MTLNDLKTLTAEGQLPEAVGAILQYAEKAGVAEVANTATLLSARIQQSKKLWNTGQLKFEDYAREHAQCTSALLNAIALLPEHPDPTATKKMVKEDVFKARLLFMLLVGKAAVIGRMIYHSGTGGFNDDGSLNCIGILAPTLAGYLYIVIEDYLRKHKNPVYHSRYVSGPLVRFAYLAVGVYMAALFVLIEKKVMPPHLSIGEFTAWFALIESFLGGYVSRVVSSFFKSE